MSSPAWEKIETVFLTAADLPVEERRIFLDEACRGDDRLRREVESLLASDAENGETIARAVEDEAEALFGLSPIVGSRLGAYQVIREIGRGGMGAVYLATRADDQFQKNVAIKLVKRGMDTTDVLRRFHYERQILAGLDHMYIARLLDAGTAPDGRPFFVMEYVEGEPVDSYCVRHALNLEDRCRLFLKVCEAVSHAHRNLVVHRDLKPGNIIVTADGTPKLLDFGVAKLLAPEADPRLTVTGMQSRLLTPQYASPEQVMGLAVNTATDVYSLGAIFYEILTGACAQNLGSTSPEEIQRVVCQTDAPLPSAATKSTLSGASLRGDIDNIVMMAMRKDPLRRYRSVEQFAADIQRYLDGRPVLARKDSVSYRVGKFVGRNRLIIAAGAFVAASLIGGIVIANAQARRAERRLSQMVELANRSLFDVHSAIERLPGAMDARREIVKTTVAYLEKLSADAGRDDDLRLSLSTAYWRLADIQGYPDKPNLGDMKAALASYQKSLDMLRPLLARRPRDPNIVMQAFDTYQHMGRIEQAMDHDAAMVRAYDSGLPYARLIAQLRPDDVEARQAPGAMLNDMAVALQFTDPKRANEAAREHLAMIPALLEKFPGDDNIADEAAVAHATMSALLSRSGDYATGLEEARASAAIREGVSARHPNDVFRQRLLMIAYGHVGDHLDPTQSTGGDGTEARDYFRKCVDIARHIVANDPQDRTARYDLAQSLLRFGQVSGPGRDFARSLAALTEAVSILEGLSAEAPTSARYSRALVQARSYQGTCLREMGRMDEALAAHRSVEAAATRIMDAHPGDVGMLLRITKSETEISTILLARGDLAGADAHAQKGLSLAQRYAGGPERGLRIFYLGNANFSLAEVDRARHDWAAARQHAQQALDAWNSSGANTLGSPPRQQASAILAEASGQLKSK
jgi:serine/threonine protein kinase/tetratricopeptide (TPR) repeat protein